MTHWDVDAGTALNEYEAHDKRIWSVDYCTSDPFLFVSGSDDGFIKARAALGHQHVLLGVTLPTLNLNEGIRSRRSLAPQQPVGRAAVERPTCGSLPCCAFCQPAAVLPLAPPLKFLTRLKDVLAHGFWCQHR